MFTIIFHKRIVLIKVLTFEAMWGRSFGTPETLPSDCIRVTT